MKTFMPKIFKTKKNTSPENEAPVYTISDGKFFRTITHPKGWSENPDYILGDDGKLYRTEYHWQGVSALPDYEFRGDRQLYRTGNHPDGPVSEPDYEIRD